MSLSNTLSKLEKKRENIIKELPNPNEFSTKENYLFEVERTKKKLKLSDTADISKIVSKLDKDIESVKKKLGSRYVSDPADLDTITRSGGTWTPYSDKRGSLSIINPQYDEKHDPNSPTNVKRRKKLQIQQLKRLSPSEEQDRRREEYTESEQALLEKEAGIVNPQEKVNNKIVKEELDSSSQVEINNNVRNLLQILKNPNNKIPKRVLDWAKKNPELIKLYLKNNG